MTIRQCLLCLVLIGLSLGESRKSSAAELNPRVRSVAIPPKNSWRRYAPGPWGQLERLSITLEFPEKLIPKDYPESRRKTQWFFTTPTLEEFEAVIGNLGLSESQQRHLVQRAKVTPEGTVSEPTDATVLSLSTESRGKLYSLLASSPRNPDQRDPFFFTNHDLETRIKRDGLSEDTARNLGRLTYRVDDQVLFCDLNLLLRMIENETEQRKVVKMLFGYPTYMLRLRIGRDSDVKQIASYWDPTGNGPVEGLLRSVLETNDEFASIDVSLLLPPFARSRLYSYPRPKRQRPWGPDCYWTAANFLREESDDAFLSPSYVGAFLQTHCDPVTDVPRYGDIAIFYRKDNADTLHAAIYLAGDMFFSKNGKDYRVPWTFSSLADLERQYSRYGAVELSHRFFRPRRSLNQ